MRLPLALLAVLVLAGCAGGGGGDAEEAGEFDDLDLVATSTTGILVGVVVDQAIRPVPDVGITVTKPDGNTLKDSTDQQGRFAFSGLQPGDYIVAASHPQFTPAQTTWQVEAGVEDPPTLRILMERLFDQAPYSELIKFDGYLACSYSFPVGSTCVNDYTRILGNSVPGCEGGCLREYNVSQQGGNLREYQSTISPGWQRIIFETIWTPSVEGTSPALTISVSYFTRPNAGHFFAGMSGPSPMRLELNLGDDSPPGQQSGEGEPAAIGPEGRPDLFVFYNNGGGPGSVTVNQSFRAFQSAFYYGLPPEGWSFVESQEMPF